MFLPGSGGGAGAGTDTVVGGAGGNGGASILLYSTEITLNGAVKVNGGDGEDGPVDSVSMVSYRNQTGLIHSRFMIHDIALQKFNLSFFVLRLMDMVGLVLM
jgi:hypothetical protein